MVHQGMIANARMYGVAPSAVSTWHALFARVAERSGVALQVIDHAFPASLMKLWTRPDLGCAFICGWPYIRGVADVVPIAAPVMLDARAGGQPVYWSDIVVRADDPARSLDDLQGRTVAFTVEDSQSGFNALRHFLRSGKRVFGREFGPVFTPRRVIEAVIAGDADAGPVDSLAHALLKLHAPQLASGIRIVAQTEPTPSPLLVASVGIDDAQAAALRAAFVGLSGDPASLGLLADLAIVGFAPPLPHSDYRVMETAARAAEAAGIRRLEPSS
jgi:ABC-type phosphate/phosphonate transport system substrate-binding protein